MIIKVRNQKGSKESALRRLLNLDIHIWPTSPILPASYSQSCNTTEPQRALAAYISRSGIKSWLHSRLESLRYTAMSDFYMYDDNTRTPQSTIRPRRTDARKQHIVAAQASDFAVVSRSLDPWLPRSNIISMGRLSFLTQLSAFLLAFSSRCD